MTLASGDAADTAALPIRADARVLAATLRAGETATVTLDSARHAYLVPARGTIEVNGTRIEARDGAAITGETRLDLRALEDAGIVLVDAA